MVRCIPGFLAKISWLLEGAEEMDVPAGQWPQTKGKRKSIVISMKTDSVIGVMSQSVAWSKSKKKCVKLRTQTRYLRN